MSSSSTARLFAIGAVALAVACDRSEPDAGIAPRPTSAPAVVASASASAEAGPAKAPKRPPLASAEFARLFRELSEPDRYFFSDNFVSNETSYLQVVPLLDQRKRSGGAYIGVGPEQNFTYIAELSPDLAFIVDIRRQNALQHLLFKAAFEEARSRSHFLALLLGRPHAPADDAPATASIEDVLARVEKAKPDRAVFEESRRRMLARITEHHGVQLSKKDRETIERTHRAFFDDQLELKFELLEDNARKYPALRELVAAKAPDGRARGFLASEAAFRTVQQLQRENRVIFVVGDFAGDHAIKAIGAELRRRDLPVNAFYVSNVEQYVIEPDKWKAYVANVDALPSDPNSVFIRCYLDQGRAHPRQLEGHRTATVLQKFDHFKWRQRKQSYTSFWTLAIDGNLGAGDAAAP